MNEALFRTAVSQECEAIREDLTLLETGSSVDSTEFAARYRLLCRRLALARDRRYGADFVGYLNALALRAHAQLYRHDTTHWLADAARMVTFDFPRALRREWRTQLCALALFLLAMVGAFLTVWLQPDLVYYFMGAEDISGMQQMYDPESERFLQPRESGGDLQMFGYYISNNIGIAFRTFASGLVFGLGSVFFLLYNGLLLGATAAHLHLVGSGATFFPFVVGHGAFELTAIVISGGAGLRLGQALMAPGDRSRLDALQNAARACVPIIYGFTGMLLVAAFIEAYWSSQHALGTTTRYGIGAALWGLVASYLFVAGRRSGT